MTLRGIMVAIYCLLLTLGTWWIVRQKKLAVPEFVATRDLPLDRRLRSDDVKAASWLVQQAASLTDGPDTTKFQGRYATGDVPKGAALRLDGTSATLLLAARDGHLTLLVSLPRGSLTALNAGSCARLSIKDSKPFAVRTVLCPASEVADCSAAIDVPLARLAEIGQSSAVLSVQADTSCQ
jgi:hypothetical protein